MTDILLRDLQVQLADRRLSVEGNVGELLAKLLIAQAQAEAEKTFAEVSGADNSAGAHRGLVYGRGLAVLDALASTTWLLRIPRDPWVIRAENLAAKSYCCRLNRLFGVSDPRGAR